jgi:hypothetical protein
MYKYIDLIRKLLSYRRYHGTMGLYRLIFLKLNMGLKAQILERAEQFAASGDNESNSLKIKNMKLKATTPLLTYSIPSSKVQRVSMITDSVGSSSLFGGVGTALIFSALLANRLDAQLRVITRTERAQPQNLDNFLTLYNIKLKHDIIFQFAAFYDDRCEVDVASEDIFITTSWWTTAATIPSVASRSIIYLLQEDERMFYSFGDERYNCEAILKNNDIRFLINTKLLFDHLVDNGLPQLEQHGQWFEPAFPNSLYNTKVKADSNQKFKLFFYARPNNPRNLFELGIEILDKSISQHIIDTDKWDIFFVGKDIPHISFSSGYTPKKLENLNWAEYANFIGTVDCGLSLMYTPHPSYPPLDLAASGAVVVTNRFGNKKDLTSYSKNIICADLDIDSLLGAVRQAVDLVQNSNLRKENYQQNGLLTDWKIAFNDVIEQLIGDL